MIPADDMPPTYPRDQLDRINAELQQEAEERRLRGEDEPAGVIQFGPPKLTALPDEDTGRRFLTVYDDGEADLDRRECRQPYPPGDEPPC